MLSEEALDMPDHCPSATSRQHHPCHEHVGLPRISIKPLNCADGLMRDHTRTALHFSLLSQLLLAALSSFQLQVLLQLFNAVLQRTDFLALLAQLLPVELVPRVHLAGEAVEQVQQLLLDKPPGGRFPLLR